MTALTLAHDPALPGFVAINDRGNTIAVAEYDVRTDRWTVRGLRGLKEGDAAEALKRAAAPMLDEADLIGAVAVMALAGERRP